MPVAEFEEKQYETPANIELGVQHAAVFAAGQVLEAVVGYDVAAHPPQNAPIWRLVGVNAPPGLRLVPNLWQRARVSTQASRVTVHLRQPHLSVQEAKVFIDADRVTMALLGCAIFSFSDSSTSARHIGDPGECTGGTSHGSVCLCGLLDLQRLADAPDGSRRTGSLDVRAAKLARRSSGMDLQCSGDCWICESQGREDFDRVFSRCLGHDQAAGETAKGEPFRPSSRAGCRN